MMTTRKSLPLFIMLLLGLLLPVAHRAAAQGAVETTLTVEPAEVTVGDPVQLVLTVKHPAGYFVIAPQLEMQWGDFTIVGESATTTTDNGDGSETTTVTYDARLFAPGAVTTPALPYTVTDGAGNLFSFTAEPVNVNVKSVLVEGDTTLRDIKPQVEIPVATWLYALGAALVLALVGGGLLWLARRRRMAPAAIDNRTPYERARDDLNEVEALGLPAAGRFNEYYTLVSESVRRFMGATWQIPVLERTTAEIQADLRATTIDPALSRRFVTFLQESDLVKFANFQPGTADADHLLGEARELVETAHASAPDAPTTPPDDNEPGDGGSAATKPVSFSENGHSTEKVPA